MIIKNLTAKPLNKISSLKSKLLNPAINIGVGLGLCLILLPSIADAQSIPRRGSDSISPEVELAYTKGLQYLAKTQSADGIYDGTYGKQPGIVGICTLAFLAHGEDSENGKYSKHIKKGIDFIINAQNTKNSW